MDFFGIKQFNGIIHWVNYIFNHRFISSAGYKSRILHQGEKLDTIFHGRYRQCCGFCTCKHMILSIILGVIAFSSF